MLVLYIADPRFNLSGTAYGSSSNTGSSRKMKHTKKSLSVVWLLPKKEHFIPAHIRLIAVLYIVF